MQLYCKKYMNVVKIMVETVKKIYGKLLYFINLYCINTPIVGSTNIYTIKTQPKASVNDMVAYWCSSKTAYPQAEKHYSSEGGTHSW